MFNSNLKCISLQWGTLFIRSLVITMFFSWVSLSCAPVLLAEKGLGPKHVLLSWTSSPQTTQTITWQTEFAGKDQVRFAEKNGITVLAVGGTGVVARTETLTTNKGIRFIHTVTLEGLKPGKQYIYQIGDGVHWTEPKQFDTASDQAKPFQFLIFGDSQSNNYEIWRSTLQSALQRHPHSAFMTNVGDLVDVGQDCAQWEAWLEAIDNGFLPLMPVTGNHETYSPERRFSKPSLFTALFSLPQNGPDGLKEQVYSFDYGDVHFVVLDSQEGEQRQSIPDLLTRQKAWLDQDLSNTVQRWKVVFIHRPPYDNRAFRDNATIRNAFVPIFDKYHVDLVFTGHDHVYARTYPLNGGKVSSGGTVYVASGRSGTKTNSLVAANPFNEFFYNPIDEPNYLHVEVTSDSIAVSAYKQSGSLIDSWSVRKAASMLQKAK